MKFPLRGHRWVLTAPLLVLMAACSGGGDEDQVGGDATADTTPATTQAPPPPPPAPASALTDGNIVASWRPRATRRSCPAGPSWTAWRTSG